MTGRARTKSLRALHWDEGKHPRDDAGKFARKGGGRWLAKVVQQVGARFGDVGVGEDGHEPQGRLQTGKGGLLDLGAISRGARERAEARTPRPATTGGGKVEPSTLKVGDHFVHNGAEHEVIGAPKAGRQAGGTVHRVQVRRIADGKTGPVTLTGPVEKVETPRAVSGVGERQGRTPGGPAESTDDFLSRMSAKRQAAKATGGVTTSAPTEAKPSVRAVMKAAGIERPHDNGAKSALSRADDRLGRGEDPAAVAGYLREQARALELEREEVPESDDQRYSELTQSIRSLERAAAAVEGGAGGAGPKGRTPGGTVDTPRVTRETGGVTTPPITGRNAKLDARRAAATSETSTASTMPSGVKLRSSWMRDDQASSAPGTFRRQIEIDGETYNVSHQGVGYPMQVSNPREPLTSFTAGFEDWAEVARVVRARKTKSTEVGAPKAPALPASQRAALAKIDTSEVGKGEGLHPGYVPVPVRQKLFAAGLVEGRETSTPLGKRDRLHLTPAGHEALKNAEGGKYEQRRADVAAKAERAAAAQAAQRAKGEAARAKADAAREKAVQAARAEGLDEGEAAIGGLQFARDQKAKRDAEAATQRDAALAIGVPDENTLIDNDYGNTSAGAVALRKLSAGMQKDGFTAEETRPALGPSASAYRQSMSDLDASRGRFARAEQRREYLSTVRAVSGDKAYQDRLDAAEADVTAARADLAEKHAAVEATRAELAQGVVDLYASKGRRKTLAGVKLPGGDTGVPAGRPLADRVAEHVPADRQGPEAEAARRAVLARLRLEDEIKKARLERDRAARDVEEFFRRPSLLRSTPEARAEIERLNTRKGATYGRARDLEAGLRARQNDEATALEKLRTAPPPKTETLSGGDGFAARMAGGMSESEIAAARAARDARADQARADQRELERRAAETRANDTRTERQKVDQELADLVDLRAVGMRSGKLDPKREARIQQLRERQEEFRVADRKEKISQLGIGKGDTVKTGTGEYEVVGTDKDGYLRVQLPGGKKGSVNPDHVESVTKAKAAPEFVMGGKVTPPASRLATTGNPMADQAHALATKLKRSGDTTNAMRMREAAAALERGDTVTALLKARHVASNRNPHQDEAKALYESIKPTSEAKPFQVSRDAEAGTPAAYAASLRAHGLHAAAADLEEGGGRVAAADAIAAHLRSPAGRAKSPNDREFLAGLERELRAGGREDLGLNRQAPTGARIETTRTGNIRVPEATREARRALSVNATGSRAVNGGAGRSPGGR